jgi:hypothetical protein
MNNQTKSTDIIIPDSLDELFDLMKNDQNVGDWDSLETFGGEEPEDTLEIWSWDETRLIIGSCPNDIKIVSRDYFHKSK